MTLLLVKLICYACMHVMGNRLRINHVQQVRNNSCRLMTPLLVSLNIMHACVCVCMDVCMHGCVHACVYVCMHVCMCACMCVCVHVCVYACAHCTWISSQV